MEQVVYGDVYLAVNFTMDWLTLWLTAKAAKLPTRLWRITAAAAVGAGYALAALVLPGDNPLSLFTSCAFPFLLCIIAFGWHGKNILPTLACFYMISFLLGGTTTALCYLIGKWSGQQLWVGGQIETLPAELPFWGLLLFALLTGALVSLLLRLRAKLPRTARLELGEERNALVRLSGLVDSGNLLTEPLSGLPVILVDRKAAAFLPPELAFLREGGTPVLTPRLRLIPYSTAAGEGILYGYLPKIVQIEGKPRTACIAIAPLPEDRNRQADAILPASLL